MVSVYLPSDALLKHLLSYLGFSYLGCWVSLHSCFSKAQLLLHTLDEGYHCCPSWPSTWDSSSRPSCARAATMPWTWGCSFLLLPLTWDVCGSSWPPLTSDMGKKHSTEHQIHVNIKVNLSNREVMGQNELKLSQLLHRNNTDQWKTAGGEFEVVRNIIALVSYFLIGHQLVISKIKIQWFRRSLVVQWLTHIS